MMRLWFKKPFALNPPEEFIPDAIIAYRQYPWVQAPPYYVSMRRTLLVDLWIIQFRIDWEKQGKWDIAKWDHYWYVTRRKHDPVYNRIKGTVLTWVKKTKTKLNIFLRNLR